MYAKITQVILKLELIWEIYPLTRLWLLSDFYRFTALLSSKVYQLPMAWFHIQDFRGNTILTSIAPPIPWLNSRLKTINFHSISFYVIQLIIDFCILSKNTSRHFYHYVSSTTYWLLLSLWFSKILLQKQEDQVEVTKERIFFKTLMAAR